MTKESPSHTVPKPAICSHAGPLGQPGPSAIFHGAHAARPGEMEAVGAALNPVVAVVPATSW